MNTLIVLGSLITIFLVMGAIVFFRQRSTAGGGAAGGGWGFTLPAMSPMARRFLGAFATFLVVNAVIAIILPSIGRVIGAQGGEFTAWMEILLFVFLILAWMGDHSRVTTQWGLGILFVVLVGGIIISATSAHTNARRAEAVATREVAREVVDVKTTKKGERVLTSLRLGDSWWASDGCTRFAVRNRNGSWPEAAKIGSGTHEDVKFHPGEVREIMFAAEGGVWEDTSAEQCEVRITRASR